MNSVNHDSPHYAIFFPPPATITLTVTCAQHVLLELSNCVTFFIQQTKFQSDTNCLKVNFQYGFLRA